MKTRNIPLVAAWAILTISSGAGERPPDRVPNSAAESKQMGDRQGKLKPGDIAPDFTLNVMHSQKSVTLSGFKNKVPVALVFGSYT